MQKFNQKKVAYKPILKQKEGSFTTQIAGSTQL